MRVAITGGRGRLAPLAARFFSDRKHDAVLFSRQSGEGCASLWDLPDQLSEFDAVFHCAWSSVPLVAERSPGGVAEHDLPFLRKLLEAPGNPLVIFPSSAAVYGNTGPSPAAEDRPPAPLGEYARGKLRAEKLLAESGKPACVLRVSNLIGERPDPRQPQGILPRLIHAANANDVVTLWGDGSATKDYLHCQDLFSALDRILSRRLAGLYNVSSETSVSLLDLIALVEKETGRSVRVRQAPHYDWDVSFSRVSNRRLREATGWAPRFSLPEAVKEVVAHFAEAA